MNTSSKTEAGVIESQTTPLESQEELNALAVEYFQGGDTESAEKLFLKAISIKPDYKLSLRNLAELYHSTERWHDAARFYEKFLENNIADEKVLNQLATVYFQTNDLVKAKSVLKKSLEVNEDQEEIKTALIELQKLESQTSEEKTEDTRNVGATDYVQLEKSKYSTSNPLKLLLKNDESIKDYMNLVHFLKSGPEKYTQELLLYLFQMKFRNIVTTYFNTSTLPQTETLEALSIVNMLELRFGIENTVQQNNRELFMQTAFSFLKEHLPKSDNKKTVSLGETEKILGNPLSNARINQMYTTLAGEFKSLYEDGLISSFMVHGSMSTLDYTRFSDFDTQIFVADKTFNSEDYLRKTARTITNANIYLRHFDPIQHHGFFLNADLDRAAYPEAFLPLTTMENATSVLGDLSQDFYLRSSDYELKFAVWHMCYFFRASFLTQQFPQNPFDTKRFLSRFALLPVLYLELFEDKYPYKRESFSMAKEKFDPEIWKVFDVVTRARERWNPKRQLVFNPAFYQSTYEFSELLLDKLRVLPHE